MLHTCPFHVQPQAKSRKKRAIRSWNNIHSTHCDFIKQYAKQLWRSEFFRIYFISDIEFFS